MRLKKIGSGLFTATLVCCIGLSVSVSATSYKQNISKFDSGALVNENSSYFFKTEYDFGSAIPFDDAYLYTESRAKSAIYQKVYAKIKMKNNSYEVDTRKGFHQLGGLKGYYAYRGSNMDYATGSGYAIIYKGYYNDSQGVLHRQDISVK